ncbi:hypothetical protein [Vreelandella neptunia]|uniref:DUF3311 domain-containing protein n=1 Tax=Vreelandella neptunia TaxID=115551 RepID=A0ABZ0YKB9_9GAMM|nr:hypothetical protein [Halomonas neptunia]MDN3560566.1 hypothetical protein [Halomonas neptunia]WQH12198.1 hypothetical protein SR894_18895 [Halomonas neptunia]
MTKQRKYFFMVISLFPLIPLSAWLFGPGSLASQLVGYGYMFIFICYWLWSASFVIKGNSRFSKKIKKENKDEKEI